LFLGLDSFETHYVRCIHRAAGYRKHLDRFSAIARTYRWWALLESHWQPGGLVESCVWHLPQGAKDIAPRGGGSLAVFH